MKRFALPLLLTLTSILAACAPSQATPFPTDSQPAAVSTEPPQADAGGLTRSDEQGAVTVEVTPLNLDNPSDQLEFDVLLDTHSVDLSMDLATLATLTTNTGVTIPATLWDAPRRSSRGRQVDLPCDRRWQTHPRRRDKTYAHHR